MRCSVTLAAGDVGQATPGHRTVILRAVPALLQSLSCVSLALVSDLASRAAIVVRPVQVAAGRQPSTCKLDRRMVSTQTNKNGAGRKSDRNDCRADRLRPGWPGISAQPRLHCADHHTPLEGRPAGDGPARCPCSASTGATASSRRWHSTSPRSRFVCQSLGLHSALRVVDRVHPPGGAPWPPNDTYPDWLSSPLRCCY
jgi:hypothetical protein